MSSPDRHHILSVLADARNSAQGRAQFYRTQPYPAMTLIAEDHAYSLALLMDAIDAGLLEQLHDDAQQRLLAGVADAEAESEAAVDEGLTIQDMRAVFGEPVEGSDYDVMPDLPEGGVH